MVLSGFFQNGQTGVDFRILISYIVSIGEGKRGRVCQACLFHQLYSHTCPFSVTLHLKVSYIAESCVSAIMKYTKFSLCNVLSQSKNRALHLRFLIKNALHLPIRLHAQALTLAALAGAAVVEYYDHKSGSKTERVAKFLDLNENGHKN